MSEEECWGDNKYEDGRSETGSEGQSGTESGNESSSESGHIAGTEDTSGSEGSSLEAHTQLNCTTSQGQAKALHILSQPMVVLARFAGATRGDVILYGYLNIFEGVEIEQGR